MRRPRRARAPRRRPSTPTELSATSRPAKAATTAGWRSDGQCYAVVTIAEGVLLPPVLVKAQVVVDSRKIEFSLPNEGGARKFTGQVTADGLTLTEAGGEKHFLKRKCY